MSATCVPVVALSLPVAAERALPGADELDVVEVQAGGALMQVRRARLARLQLNEVNARRARLQLGTGMGDRLRAGIPSRAVTSQLGQLSLASLRGRLIEYQLRLG